MKKPLTIEKEVFETYSPGERLEFEKLVRIALASESLKEGSDEHTRLLERVKWLSNESQKEIGNATKQRNRKLVTFKFTQYVKEHGFMPTTEELVELTGLSHTTVHKHQKAILNGEIIQEQVERFAFLREEFLNQIGFAGVKGDLKAAKMALDLLLKFKPEPQVVLSDEKSTEALHKLLELIPEDRQDEANEILHSVSRSMDVQINNQLKQVS